MYPCFFPTLLRLIKPLLVICARSLIGMLFLIISMISETYMKVGSSSSSPRVRSNSSKCLFRLKCFFAKRILLAMVYPLLCKPELDSPNRTSPSSNERPSMILSSSTMPMHMPAKSKPRSLDTPFIISGNIAVSPPEMLIPAIFAPSFSPITMSLII